MSRKNIQNIKLKENKVEPKKESTFLTSEQIEVKSTYNKDD